MNYLFLLFMIIFCITDYRGYWIPNIVVLPAIVVGCALTLNILPAVLLFGVGALYFHKKRIGGGDVKMMALSGAFLGWYGISAFLFSRFLVYIYRKIDKYQGPLPFAPFLTMGCLPFLFI